MSSMMHSVCIALQDQIASESVG